MRIFLWMTGWMVMAAVAVQAGDRPVTEGDLHKLRAEIAELQSQLAAAEAQLAAAQAGLVAAESALHDDPAREQRFRQWQQARGEHESERLALAREKLRLEGARLALARPAPAPLPPPAPLRPEYQSPPDYFTQRVTPYCPSYFFHSHSYPLFIPRHYYHTPYYYVSTPSTPVASPPYYAPAAPYSQPPSIAPQHWPGASYQLNYNSDHFRFRLSSPVAQPTNPYRLSPTQR